MKIFLTISGAVVAALALVFISKPERVVAPAEAQTTATAEAAEPLVEEASLKEIRRDVLLPARGAPRAPGFAPGAWVNSEPLKIDALRGRVVIVDFWTFGCYNCRNTLPALKRWDEQYRERGLTLIGVHSPEFEREKQLENVRREVSSLGIRYAVVTDNDYETWNAYHVQAWPTIFVLDKQGRVRFTHIGEGMYDEIEDVIRKLLAE